MLKNPILGTYMYTYCLGKPFMELILIVCFLFVFVSDLRGGYECTISGTRPNCDMYMLPNLTLPGPSRFEKQVCCHIDLPYDKLK